MSFFEERKGSKLGSPGPFLAIVTNQADPARMGRIEVALIKGLYPDTSNQASTYVVKYLSPFYGVTSSKFEGNNNTDFQDVQKSYGMWMVTPDVGTRVLVIFIDGDPNQGYWIGCVPDTYQNHMLPGIAASETVAITPEQERKYGTKYLPVAEFLKGTQTLNAGIDVGKFAKPVHPFADRLLAQGLIIDKIRGVTSSSARREAPSSVFGISTPGPIDPNGKKGKVGYGAGVMKPVSRLGGSTLVMDDGDANGDNELVRIRTRTGHQILLHNTHDLIYIANGKGTAWIEMTSDGKIDIYAKDSVSIHSEADFNFRAERDINLEAGRSINIGATKDLHAEIGENYNLKVGKDGKIQFEGKYDHTVTDDFKFATTSGNFDLKISGTIKQTAGKNFNIAANGNNNFSANGNTNISTQGTHYESAKEIHMNGPTAATADPAESATIPKSLIKYSLPNNDPDVGWAGKQYKTTDIVSIMQRVPTFEPWEQHENNTNRVKVNSTATDVTTGTANKKAE
jgi:mannose-6-phosphate isomerase-like protein (cupin superfamily)